jgi:tRNA(Ile)-lysidine synthase
VIPSLTNNIREHRLFDAGDKVLVAVSGGIDSVVLLHALWQMKRKGELNVLLYVVHVDHGLREESGEDARFVQELAEKWGLPCHVGRFDVAAYAKQHRLSIQVAARDVRYEYFAKVAEEVGATKLATAHQADDQAETVLMRILRGTSIKGLGGIPLRRREAAYEIVRPLLATTREEIEGYARDQGLNYREDASNASTKYLRNKIRIRLLPELEREYNRGVKAGLNQLAAMARDDEALLAELAREAYAKAVEEEVQGRIRVKANVLGVMPLPLQRRVITLILYYLCGHTIQWEHLHVESILKMLGAESPSAELSLPAGIAAWREYDSLLLGERPDLPLQGEAPLEPFTVSFPGTHAFPELGFRLEGTVVDGVPPRPRDAWEALFDADELSGSCIYIRTWATGDTIRPIGLHGTKLISDVFGEAKIPRHRRSRWPLLCLNGEIAWVIGIRRAQIAAVSHNTTRTLVLRATELT